MTILEIESKLYPCVNVNERRRLDWYKKKDIKKYLKEISKLWRKYEDQLDGRIF
nr:MAG TPA: hypothetical protein [Caudoviricetes sp.]